jgi:1-phosphatidylinositol-3-phosphate 5-kinase
MMSQDKSDIRIRFNDYDDRGQLLCKFSCQVYWAKQFEALRKCYFQDDSSGNAAAISESLDNFIRSLAMSARWSAQGGKSGASFSKTMDERMVIKVISRVELQMFLDFAPAYFEYMAKAYYQYLPTVMCKILGVYTVRYDNKETGKRVSARWFGMWVVSGGRVPR